MFVFLCGTGRKNPLYCTSWFYSVFIISQLKEKGQEIYRLFCLTMQSERKRKKNKLTEVTTDFFLLYYDKDVETEGERELPGEISPFNLHYHTSKESPSLPCWFSFISKDTRWGPNYYRSSRSSLLNFIFCYLVSKENSSVSGSTGPDLTSTMNCCSVVVRPCKESSFSHY